jgi:hypothetical protein
LNKNYDTNELAKVVDRIREAAGKESAEEMEAAVAPGSDSEGNLFKDLKRAISRGGASSELHSLSNDVDNVQLEWEPARLQKNVGQMRAALGKLQDIGDASMNIYGQLQPHGNSRLSNFSGPASNVSHEKFRRQNGALQLPAENTAYLGRSLFTDYLLPVELGGTLLLVATIGAIAIAYRRGGKPS